MERFMDKVSPDPNTGCWLWKGGLYPAGYGRLLIGANRTRHAHRVSWILFQGEIPTGYLVCHKCDIRNCVNPDHLFLGTPAENTRDMVQKNRHHFGEKHYRAKLTASQVSEIRKLFTSGTPPKELAAAFGVTTRHIKNIGRGNTWKCLNTSAAVRASSEMFLPLAARPYQRKQETHSDKSSLDTGDSMSSFQPAFEFVMSHEDPHCTGKVTVDAGGRTRFGIAQKFHPDLPDAFFTGPAADALKQAEEILRRDYWDSMRLSEIANQNVANKLFDMAVNMGVHQAAVYAQRAANGLIHAQVALPTANGDAGLTPLTPLTPMFPLREDGVLGEKSVATINSFDPIRYYGLLCDLSRQHYVHVASINPAQAGNLQGWLKRAAA